tara:strand:- start:197 stop:1138 length:942 start_codon:yes stop_codon:yes gene_type:complete
MYGKHFAQMYSGSMVGSGPLVFAIWGYIIANANKDSTVEINPVITATQIGCSVEDVEATLSFLQQTDDKSRTPDEEGRRLIKLDNFSYHIVTHAKYSNIQKDDERRAYMRKYMAEKRDNEKRDSKDVNVNRVNGKQLLTVLGHIDKDGDINTNKDKEEIALDSSLLPPKRAAWTPNSEQSQINKLFNRRETTKWSTKELRAFKAIDMETEDLGLIVRYYKAEPKGDLDMRRRDIATLLNNWPGEVDRARAALGGVPRPVSDPKPPAWVSDPNWRKAAHGVLGEQGEYTGRYEDFDPSRVWELIQALKEINSSK